MSMVRVALAVLTIAACGVASHARAVTVVSLSNGHVADLPDLTGSYDGPNIGSSTIGSVSGNFCYGSQSASALGGSDPSVSISYTEAAGGCNGAGGSGLDARVSYSFVYDPSNPADTAPASVLMVASDALAASLPQPTNQGGSSGDAWLEVSAFDATPVYAVENCFNNLALSCNVDPFASTTQPIGNTVITIEPYVVYTVTMGVDAFPAGAAGGPASSASLDPEFFLQNGEPGQIYYSNGVSQAEVPEPASLSLLATGLIGLLGLRRSRVTKI